MPLFSAIYSYSNDEATTQRRNELGEAHVAYLNRLIDEKTLLLAGLWGVGDSEGGQLLVNAATEDEARKIIDADPNVSSGCAEVTMCSWKVVLGPLAETMSELGAQA